MLNKPSLIHAVLLFVAVLTLIICSTIVNNTKYELSANAQGTTEEKQFSIQITKARDDIRKELINQGQIASHQIEELFGFENVESNLTQAYQTSFTGDIPSAVTQLLAADNALESSIISMSRSGQELVSVSQNESVFLDDKTRIILSDFGKSLSNLSEAANDIRSRLNQLKYNN
jgi:hypothetical protein